MERSKRSVNVHMKHEYDDGVNRDSNLSRLEPNSVRAPIKEDSQLRSQMSQVFQVISHIVGFRSVLRVVNFNSCRCNHLLNFDLYSNSL